MIKQSGMGNEDFISGPLFCRRYLTNASFAKHEFSTATAKRGDASRVRVETSSTATPV